MCNPASMIATKDRVYWSKTTDSHHEIISEYNLYESGIRGVNVVPLEIVPKDGNLSIPLSKWKFSIDYEGWNRELPEWWDDKKYEAMARAELKNWGDVKLKGWKVKEAFNPINPLKQKQDKSLDKVALLRDWASVRQSVGQSVWAYIGSLFHNITQWKYCPPDKKRPWHSLRKLWLGGYVPSFDGKTWRLHAGLKAKVVFEITAEELKETP